MFNKSMQRKAVLKSYIRNAMEFYCGMLHTTKNSGGQVKRSEDKKGHAEEDSPDYIESNDTEANQEDETFYLCKVWNESHEYWV